MSCRICGRNSCTESFHSLKAIERQDRIDSGECEDCIDKDDEIEQLKADVKNVRDGYAFAFEKWQATEAELAKAKPVLDAVEDILQDLPKDDETRELYVGHLHRAMRLRKAFREMEE